MDKIIFKLTPWRIFRQIKTLMRRYIAKRKIKNMGLGHLGKHVTLGLPSAISNPQLVFLHDYVRIHQQNIIYNYTGKFIMKEYSCASIGLLVVTGNHKPTVGIPQFMLGSSHVNDVETDVIVEEDVWIGVRVTLLAGAHIGRGVVIGASSLVNKEIPPYAVVVGSPARIIAAKFTIEQIIEHEKLIYPENKRFTKEYLESIFEKYYKDKKTMGITSDLKEVGFYDFMSKQKYKYIHEGLEHTR